MKTLNKSLEDCRLKWKKAKEEGDIAKMKLWEKIGKKIKDLISLNTP